MNIILDWTAFTILWPNYLNGPYPFDCDHLCSHCLLSLSFHTGVSSVLESFPSPTARLEQNNCLKANLWIWKKKKSQLFIWTQFAPTIRSYKIFSSACSVIRLGEDLSARFVLRTEFARRKFLIFDGASQLWILSVWTNKLLVVWTNGSFNSSGLLSALLGPPRPSLRRTANVRQVLRLWFVVCLCDSNFPLPCTIYFSRCSSARVLRVVSTLLSHNICTVCLGLVHILNCYKKETSIQLVIFCA